MSLCLRVRVGVCQCVCGSSIYSLNRQADFDEISHEYSKGYRPVLVFSDFEYLD